MTTRVISLLALYIWLLVRGGSWSDDEPETFISAFHRNTKISLNCGKYFNDLTNSVLAFVREFFDNPAFNKIYITYTSIANVCTLNQWIGVDVGGKLYLPEDWFTAEKAELREKLGIPAELK